MKPDEHKTVQARILAYAEAIGWTFVSHEGAELRRGFDPAVPPADRAKNLSLFFDDLFDAKVREFNPRNVFEVTEEWAFHNGHRGTREDVVLLINGIPIQPGAYRCHHDAGQSRETARYAIYRHCRRCI